MANLSVVTRKVANALGHDEFIATAGVEVATAILYFWLKPVQPSVAASMLMRHFPCERWGTIQKG